MRILVTGAGSQLGRCLADSIAQAQGRLDDTWVFKTHKELDITNEESILKCFAKELPDIVVNCAAYTDVEKAEDEFYKANLVNCIGVHYLSEACQRTSTFLIHISTDYVYKQIDDLAFSQDDWQDRISSKMLEAYAFSEDAELEPLNKYGITKYLGERILMQSTSSIIIRTSWLYSEYGKNFVKTVINSIDHDRPMNIVDDQIGRPTNAHDLADFIAFGIIGNRKFVPGLPCIVYNYQNAGTPCSWYEFAKEIERTWTKDWGEHHIEKTTSDRYPTKAKRPKFSALNLDNTSKLASIPFWGASLHSFLNHNKLKLKEEISISK